MRWRIMGGQPRYRNNPRSVAYGAIRAQARMQGATALTASEDKPTSVVATAVVPGQCD